MNPLDRRVVDSDSSDLPHYPRFVRIGAAGRLRTPPGALIVARMHLAPARWSTHCGVSPDPLTADAVEQPLEHVRPCRAADTAMTRSQAAQRGHPLP